MIEDSPLTELREITNGLDGLMIKAVLINSGGFFLTWPVFLMIYVVNRLRRTWSTRVRELVRSVLFGPQDVLVRLGHNV